MTLNRRHIAIAGLALLATPAAFAQDEEVAPPAPAPQPVMASAALTITLESTGDIERTVETYQCEDGQAIAVQYINAAPNFLAILPVDGQNHVFATTISASGARYISGPYEWWSHQGEGTLRDLMQDEDAEPLASCISVENTP